MSIKPAHSGFTLIEIMVVVSIMVVLSGMGVASYIQMDNRAKVEMTANVILSELRNLQKDANSGNSKCAAGSSFKGKSVTYNSGKFVPLDRCDNGGVITTVARDSVPAAGVPSNISVSLSRTPFIIYPLNKGIDADTTIRVGNSAVNPSIEYEVRITQLGGISVTKTK